LEAPLTKELLSWLLGQQPWVVYRTLVDLLDKGQKDEAVLVARMAVSEHRLVKRIFQGLNEEGYWRKPKDIHTWWPRKDTTFWILPVLADFGFTVLDERIARACEYVLSTQLISGAFGWDPPTKPGDWHTAIITESLAKLGLLSDTRVGRAYDWLIKRQRLDGDFGARILAASVGQERRSPVAQWPRCLRSAHSLRIPNFSIPRSS